MKVEFEILLPNSQREASKAERSNSGSTNEPEAEALTHSNIPSAFDGRFVRARRCCEQEFFLGMIWTLCWRESEEPEVADQNQLC